MGLVGNKPNLVLVDNLGIGKTGVKIVVGNNTALWGSVQSGSSSRFLSASPSRPPNFGNGSDRPEASVLVGRFPSLLTHVEGLQHSCGCGLRPPLSLSGF